MSRKSWKAELQDSGGWVSNRIRFPRQEQAERYAQNLRLRRSVATAWRVTETPDQATHWYRADNVLLPLDLPRDRREAANRQLRGKNVERDEDIDNNEPGDLSPEEERLAEQFED
jgi:hypothetical protein